jgi:hypothetical protein
MAAPKAKSKEQLMERRARVSELYLQCQTMAEIGRQIGVSANTIYHDICWAREQWRARAADTIEIHKQRELARIDNLEVEAWRGWKRSIGKVKTTKTETGQTATGPIDKTSETIQYQAGDPRFLDNIARCIESRRKIMGLDTPIPSVGPEGGPIRYVIEGIAGAEWLKDAEYMKRDSEDAP